MTVQIALQFFCERHLKSLFLVALIVSYLETKILLTPFQSGFGQGTSTLTQLTHVQILLTIKLITLPESKVLIQI